MNMTKEKAVKVNKLEESLSSETNSDSDNQLPELKDRVAVQPSKAVETECLTKESKSDSKQSKSEKKARKAMSKLGLERIHGVSRIVIRRPQYDTFVIKQPDVYKSPVLDTYIVFGRAVLDEPAEGGCVFGGPPLLGDTPEESDDESEVDDSGVEAKDIELVMSQASVSKSKAVKALKNNNNDIVNAIMELTI